jgi:hypothetical protein
LKFDYLQDEMGPDQTSQLSKIVKVLNEKPGLEIVLKEMGNGEDAVEKLASFLSRQEYLGLSHLDSLSEPQKQEILQLSIKDSLFVMWLDKKFHEPSPLESVQHKCIRYHGVNNLEQKLIGIRSARNAAIIQIFMESNIDPGRVVVDSTGELKLAAGGSPKYGITYVVDEDGGSDSVVTDDGQ